MERKSNKVDENGLALWIFKYNFKLASVSSDINLHTQYNRRTSLAPLFPSNIYVMFFFIRESWTKY
jgi:hypothetical protein